MSDDTRDDVRSEAESFREWLSALPSDEHRTHALKILWDDICPDCGSADDDAPRPCNCIDHQKIAQVNAEAALHWALDIIDRQDRRLIDLGDSADKVNSAVHLRGKEMARGALRQIANFAGCCHLGDTPASPRESAFEVGYKLKPRPRATLAMLDRSSEEKP